MMKEYFEKNNILVLSWNEMSPDVNPMENFCAYLRDKLGDTCYNSIEGLKIA